MCASKEGEAGDFLDPATLQDLLAFGDNLAKTQGASPKIIDAVALEEYLGNPQEMAPVCFNACLASCDHPPHTSPPCMPIHFRLTLKCSSEPTNSLWCRDLACRLESFERSLALGQSRLWVNEGIPSSNP